MTMVINGTSGLTFNDASTQSTAAISARSWQTGSLSNNVNATNTYGKEIIVAASCAANGSYGWNDYCYVNDVLIINAYWNAAVVGMTYVFPVPAGATYRVNFPTGITAVMLYR